MRARLTAVPILFAAFGLLFVPADGWTQGGGKGGKGGGKGPPGRMGMMLGGDPGQIFDMLAKGRDHFLASENMLLGKSLAEFAQKNGVSDGKITKDLFVRYSEEMKKSFSTGGLGGGGFPGGGFGGFPFPGGGFAGGGKKGMFPFPGGPAMITGGAGGSSINLNPLDALKNFAEMDFKRRDDDENGFLNIDEMPSSLREDLTRWDTNQDEKIDLAEYRAYFTVRMQDRMERDRSERGKDFNPVASLMIVEEDLDRRPDVFRAGKIPREVTTADGKRVKVPEWFERYDKDKDGQISLFEWRNEEQDISEFKSWDRNGDGLLTVQEVVFKESLAMGTPRNGSYQGNGGNFSGERDRKGKGDRSDMFKKKKGGGD